MYNLRKRKIENHVRGEIQGDFLPMEDVEFCKDVEFNSFYNEHMIAKPFQLIIKYD